MYYTLITEGLQPIKLLLSKELLYNINSRAFSITWTKTKSIGRIFFLIFERKLDLNWPCFKVFGTYSCPLGILIGGSGCVSVAGNGGSVLAGRCKTTYNKPVENLQRTCCHKLSQAMQTHPDIAFSGLSGKISPDFCRFYGGGIRHNEDIMHSFQNFIVRLIPNYPPPLETRIWKLVVRALIGLL